MSNSPPQVPTSSYEAYAAAKAKAEAAEAEAKTAEAEAEVKAAEAEAEAKTAEAAYAAYTAAYTAVALAKAEAEVTAANAEVTAAYIAYNTALTKARRAKSDRDFAEKQAIVAISPKAKSAQDAFMVDFYAYDAVYDELEAAKASYRAAKATYVDAESIARAIAAAYVVIKAIVVIKANFVCLIPYAAQSKTLKTYEAIIAAEVALAKANVKE